ncbi:MAG: hypothetical protein ABGX31_03165 [bacterium]
MEIDLAILADAATIDATGKLNILGVFDRIQVSKFPAQFARIALVLRLAAGTSEVGAHEMDIKLIDPGGGEILSLNGEMQLGSGGNAGGGLRVPHILNIDGLVFPGPGIYSFDVKIDQEHHVTISLFVEGSDTN